MLYPQGFQQPATYIRSSATVEDCAGSAYCLDEQDDLALKLINARLPAGQSPILEDQFEDVMNFFEETAQTRQPFAAVDSPPVLPLEELQEHFDGTLPDHVRNLSALVYEHWASRRAESANRAIPPHLKFETGQEHDDADPYVCFRRRELRQIRKTRNRDAQSAEKLRKLRLEMESARNVLLAVKRRETLRKECLEIDRQVFDQRSSFRDTKRKLGIKGDEELLINQKKQKLPQGMSPNQAALAQQLRMPMSAGSGTELRTLEEVRGEKERGINNEISINIEKHIRWNEGFVDKTKYPLTPDSERDFEPQPGQFREAMPATEYLPTPPASHSDEEAPDVEIKPTESRSSTPFRYASPEEDDGGTPIPSFRRRVGRGGRLMMDRKFPTRSKKDSDPENDRWRFDSDQDSDMEEYPDQTGWTFARMTQRAQLYSSGRHAEQQARQAAREAQQASSSSVPPATAS